MMQPSIWETETYFARRDVIIIGSGLAGLWCAYELLIQNPSLRLLLIDSGIVPSGASTRNAGFACFGSPTELLQLARDAGENVMWQQTEMRYKGIDKIKTIFKAYEIDYEPVGGYECLTHQLTDTEQLHQALPWLNKGMKTITGNPDTFSWANEMQCRLGLQGFDALLHNKYEGALHSGKLVVALQRKVTSFGAQILTGSEAVKVEETSDGVDVFTKQNIPLQATRVIICTNALSPHLMPDIPVKPARGQILLTTPIKDLQLQGTFHFDEGFYYFRNVGNRILLGGARNKAFEAETTTHMETTGAIQEELERLLREKIVPGAHYAIEQRWSGIMGFTDQKVPQIRQVSPCVQYVNICNGMGVAMAPIMAERVAETF